MHDFKLYYLINCGLMIVYNGTCIMIDALNGPDDFFDDISDEDLNSMLENRDFFVDCDYLIYTHHHFDHFDADRNISYMSLKKPKALFLPLNSRSFFKRVQKGAADNNVELISPDFANGEHGTIDLNGCKLSYFNVGHIGKEYSDVPHYSFVLELGDTKLFIAADSDYLNYDKHLPIIDQKIDIAFYNPFYMNHTTGRKIVKAINARQNYVYHLPYSKKDVAGIRHQLDRAIQKYTDDIGDLCITPLDTPMTEII